MTRLAVLLAAALLLAACGGTPASVAPTFAEIPGHASGQGSGESATFTLRGGEYGAVWNATPAGCYFGASIRQFAGGWSAPVTSGTSDGKVDQAIIHDVPAGQFYVVANGACAWDVEFSPLH